MFKNKIILLNEDWEFIYQYKSRFKPIVDEFIFIESHYTYYKIINVIHTRKLLSSNTTLIVKKWDSFKK